MFHRKEVSRMVRQPGFETVEQMCPTPWPQGQNLGFLSR